MIRTIPAAIRRLNALSKERWGPSAPRYSCVRKGTPPIYYIHREQDAGPWLPACTLWARGPRDHCLAKLRSAIEHAISQPLT